MRNRGAARRLRGQQWLRALGLVITLLGGAIAADAEPIADGAFVRVRGAEFVVNGRPFRFVGANIDPLHGDINRPRRAEIVRALADDGLTVARVWVLGEGAPNAKDWSRSFELLRAGPLEFLEEPLIQLDHVLHEARRSGVRVILTLANHWADYGGVPQYLKWLGLPVDASGLQQEAFYSDERALALYFMHIERLLGRRNTVTGVRYIDDPTIFAWELMNESQVQSDAAKEARRRVFAQVARFIKARDPNHLVGAGLLGYSTRAERTEWLRVHALPEIDYADSHLYLQNSEAEPGLLRMRQLLDDRVQLGRFVLRKPLIIGEFGFRTDGPKRYLGLPRAQWFEALLGRVFQDGGSGGLVWIYQPYHGKPRDFGIYIDRSDTDDVRAALRRVAQRLQKGPGFGSNPALGPQRGSAPMYQTERLLRAHPAPHRGWKATDTGAELTIPPGGFAFARFERLGTWDKGDVSHFYGADAGVLRYRFAAPGPQLLTRAPPGTAAPKGKPAAARPLVEVRIEARVSSEWPGAGAPPDGGSLLIVQLDGVEIGRREILPDDGRGRTESFSISDRALLARLARGEHTLTFTVPEGDRGHGLCVYGEAHAPGLSPADFKPLRVRYLITP